MKVETAKEKVIREAYGKFYKICNPDENGWNHFFSEDEIENDFESKGNSGDFCSRPKSISGIETNNGWICIKDKLPEIGDKIISRRDLCERIIEEIETVTRDFLVWYDMNNITHWKHYVSQPPIY